MTQTVPLRSPAGAGQNVRARSMLHSSLGLILGKVSQMGLGFLFWVLAAHLGSSDDVGLAAGAVSAVMLCTQLALLGVGAAFIINYPHHPRPSDLLDNAVAVVGVAATLVASVVLALMGTLSGEFRALTVFASFLAAFIAVTVLGSVALMFDQVSMALGRGDQVLQRNVISGGLALALLAVLHALGANVHALQFFVLWGCGSLAAFLIGLYQLRRALSYNCRPKLQRPVAGALVRVGAPNHLLTLAERTPGLLLPVLVTAMLSLSANAHWYLIWMMAWAIYVTPISIGIGLFAEASRRPESAGAATRKAIIWSLAVGGSGALVLALVAHPVLSLLGPGYAEAGVAPLRILLLALLPMTVIQAYFATCRSRGINREAIVAATLTAVAACSVMPAVGANSRFGLEGMAVVWVVVQLSAGLWAGWRLYRLSGTAPTPHPAHRLVAE